MSIKVLVALMGFILLSLYVFVKIYRPKEKLQMELEANYIESLKKFHSNKNNTSQNDILALGKKYVHPSA